MTEQLEGQFQYTYVEEGQSPDTDEFGYCRGY